MIAFLNRETSSYFSPRNEPKFALTKVHKRILVQKYLLLIEKSQLLSHLFAGWRRTHFTLLWSCTTLIFKRVAMGNLGRRTRFISVGGLKIRGHFWGDRQLFERESRTYFSPSSHPFCSSDVKLLASRESHFKGWFFRKCMTGVNATDMDGSTICFKNKHPNTNREMHNWEMRLDHSLKHTSDFPKMCSNTKILL